MQSKEANQELLAALHKTSNGTPIVDKSVTAQSPATVSQPAKKSKGKQNKKGKSKTEVKGKREVKAYAVIPVDKQSRYEQRYYMRDFHTNEAADVVRHKSAFGIEEAAKSCLAQMRKAFKDKGFKGPYKTYDFILGIDSYGPSYGDCIRNAMRRLAKQGIVRIDPCEDGGRAKFQYTLVQTEVKDKGK